MLSNHTLDTLWISILPIVLTGVCDGLFPDSTLLHLAFLPAWCLRLLLTRSRHVGIWISIWFGLLLETSWILPPGACILFFLICWSIVEAFRKDLPDEILSSMGFLCGAILTPVLLLWIFFYVLLFVGWDSASYLLPTIRQLIFAPVVGALGGVTAFHLARKCEFLALKPSVERRIIDGD